MNQLIVTRLERNVVQIVFQVLRLKRINAFESAKVLQFKLVFYSNLFKPRFLFLVVRGSRQPLQSALLLDPGIVHIAHLPAIIQIQETNRVNQDTFFNLMI